MRDGLAKNTVEVIAREWLAKVAATQAETTHTNVYVFLKVMCSSLIGNRPIAELATPDPLALSSVFKAEARSISHAGCITFAGRFLVMLMAKSLPPVTLIAILSLKIFCHPKMSSITRQSMNPKPRWTCFALYRDLQTPWLPVARCTVGFCPPRRVTPRRMVRV